MRDFVKKGFTAGLGLAVISKERAEKTMKDLVKRGEISPQASRELLDKLITRGEQESEQLDRQLRERMKKILNEMEVATQEDLEQLEQHIRILEHRLDKLSPLVRSSDERETRGD
ncbi:MAG: polyhydroxyalkanoate synthesis regulator [Firmicutes bacterium]|uniref:Polyhydroxyalkanoate synthesis regulator phasin n=1 Tax=Melghirimyces thermohalophilus TaxID=1236220 RepID=A0A1G6KRN9_9BACL|nr:polyhydroxyalkanoate synthesis regulator [Melghirimyces thermohalophilus]MDA8354499.1 polyhydroxyalkanoate synthesis regulator [Bacillota bacterium]SDC33749.1 Polyhydroxyalkanoate synthesis regulator phasin [Melghirimyces thermohalophilus]